MNKKFLLLTSKVLGVLIEKTQTKPHETLEFKPDKEMEIFSFDVPFNSGGFENGC